MGGGCKKLDKTKCDVLKDFTVFNQNHTVHFNHKCSELGYKQNYVFTYAFFEKTDPNSSYKVLALTKLLVGWVGNLSNIQKGIAVSLSKFQMAGFNDWAGDNFAFALKVHNLRSGQEFFGPFSEIYYDQSQPYDGNAYRGKTNYQISSNGDFYLESIIEDRNKNNTAKMSETIKIPAQQIDSLEDPLQLYLIIKNQNKNSYILLKGPKLQNITNLFNIKKPEMKVLGLLESFNPKEEGGVIAWYRDSARYGECIYQRKWAKKEFEKYF